MKSAKDYNKELVSVTGSGLNAVHIHNTWVIEEAQKEAFRAGAIAGRAQSVKVAGEYVWEEPEGDEQHAQNAVLDDIDKELRALPLPEMPTATEGE